MKHIEKDGEKIVYSKGLPQYFISDVAEEDVICPYDENELKYVLNDKFTPCRQAFHGVPIWGMT